MLRNCRRDQWRIEDLDWSEPPRDLSREDEIAIVQYFTDMAGIERLAGALFEEQGRRTEDATLREIFASFVVDEERHADVAERLARYYDVHRYKTYAQNPHLVRFRPHFLNAIRYLSDDVANAYITSGELILDVALLRSIDDFVHDTMSAAAMRLVNRDESRHIAVDYHMVEYYASDAYAAKEAAEKRARRGLSSVRRDLAAVWTFAHVIYFARPFFREVFFLPMNHVDPTGRRIREAFRRIQLLGARPSVQKRPFTRFMMRLQDLYNHPILGPLVGPAAARLAGVEPQFLQHLVTQEEEARANAMSFDDLAREALSAKLAS